MTKYPTILHVKKYPPDNADVLFAVITQEVCGVALGRPTFQSSAYTHSGVKHSPSLATDGSFNLTSCAISDAGTNPWWAVDLGHHLRVSGVRLTTGVNHGKLVEYGRVKA